MEAKRSKTGLKRYPREMKRRVADRRVDNNLSLKKTQAWAKKEYGEIINLSTIGSWTEWRRAEKLGLTGGSSAEVHNSRKAWNEQELQELKLGVELGLTNEQIAQCMEEDPDLNYRKYTSASISMMKTRKGLTKNINWEKSTQAEQRAKDLLKEMEMSLVHYRNSHQIKVKCDKCGSILVKTLDHLRTRRRCSMCIIPPNSYHEIYVIEFYNFGNPSVKVGISADYYNKRRKSFPEHKVIEVYKTTFKKAKEIENLIKEQYGIYRTTPPELHNNGSTECYDISQTELIDETIKEQLYG